MDGDESSARDDDEVGQPEGARGDEPAGSSDSDASPDETDAPDAPDSEDPPEEDTQADGIEDPEPDEEADGDDSSDVESGGPDPDTDVDPETSGDDGAEDAADGESEDDMIGKFRGNPALDGPTGPDQDREMPLADHIEEMLRRLAVVVAVAGIVSLAVFPIADEVINFLWYSILPGVETEIARPRVYDVLELWFTRVKVASLAGLIVALPVLVYETYAFMKPGLYPHERRYYLAAIPTSLVLAIVGASFAYFIVLPAIFVYFLYYSQDVATIGFALGRTFDLILLMMGYLAIVFQIPMFIMLAMMMGLVTRRWLADRRLLFWGAFLGVSFLFGFDPTGMAPILVAATMIVLFEGTLLLTKWTGRE